MSTAITQSDLDLDRGLFERQLGFSALDFADKSEWENRVIEHAIRYVASRGEPFTSDDVRPLLPEVHQNRIGRGFSAAADRGEIEAVGFKRSAVVSSHGRRVLQWAAVKHQPV